MSNHIESLSAVAEICDGVSTAVHFYGTQKDELARNIRAVLKENAKLREALEIITHVVGHNSCTDGKTPNGFVVALDRARAALARVP